MTNKAFFWLFHIQKKEIENVFNILCSNPLLYCDTENFTNYFLPLYLYSKPLLYYDTADFTNYFLLLYLYKKFSETTFTKLFWSLLIITVSKVFTNHFSVLCLLKKIAYKIEIQMLSLILIVYFSISNGLIE